MKLFDECLLDNIQAEIGKGCIFRNDAPTTVPDLEAKMHDLTQRVTALQAAVDSEMREMTAEESKQRKELMDEFDATEQELEARLRMQEQEARLAASSGRKTTSDNIESIQAAATANIPQTPAAQDAIKNMATASTIPARPSYYGSGGYSNLGEFAVDVMRARSGTASARLRQVKNQEPGSYGSEGVDADGGFAVPPDFREEIMRKVMGEESLVSFTDQQTTTSKSMSFPIDETTSWQATGGIQANWTAEAGKKPESKPLIGEAEVTLHKLTALIPLTDELIEDAPAMTRYLNSKVPEAFTYRLNDAIINGTGTGQPLGILSSSALLTVPAEAGQAADTITAMNIVKMRSAMYSRGKSRGVWIANPLIEEQLAFLSFPVPTGATAVPLYMPPGGLSATPYATLMGRPVITTEAAPDNGDVGDLIFADLSQYMTLTRRGAGLRQDISIHLYFDYDVTAFRFVLRFGGRPWWTTPINGKTANRKYSAFVALAERTGA